MDSYSSLRESGSRRVVGEKEEDRGAGEDRGSVGSFLVKVLRVPTILFVHGTHFGESPLSSSSLLTIHVRGESRLRLNEVSSVLKKFFLLKEES